MQVTGVVAGWVVERTGLGAESFVLPFFQVFVRPLFAYNFFLAIRVIWPTAYKLFFECLTHLFNYFK